MDIYTPEHVDALEIPDRALIICQEFDATASKLGYTYSALPGETRLERGGGLRFIQRTPPTGEWLATVINAAWADSGPLGLFLLDPRTRDQVLFEFLDRTSSERRKHIELPEQDRMKIVRVTMAMFQRNVWE